MKFVRTTILFSLILLLCSWGEKGHQKINGSSTDFFQCRLKRLKSWTGKLSEHASDADYRKRTDRTEGVKHFIDMDGYADFVNNHQITEDKEDAFNKYGKEFVVKNGTLPWVTDSTYRVLVNQFRSKEWAKALLTAADLGHYVGDGFMPLHLTTNYDGKLTGQTGIHSRYESTMINRYINEVTVNKSRIHKVHNVNRYVFDYIYSNYQYKDSLLNADKLSYESANSQYTDLYYQTLWIKTQGFTRKMIGGSSKALAELIKTAWIEAGRPRIPRGINSPDTPQN